MRRVLGGVAVALVGRMIRAARGEVGLYDEVMHDSDATREALVVLAIAVLAGGIARGLGLVLEGHTESAIRGIVLTIIASAVGFPVFIGVTYFVGKHLFGAHHGGEEILRTYGYAYSPAVLQVVSFLPTVGHLVSVVVAIWTLYLIFVALRCSLDITPGQTITTILLASIPTALIAFLILPPSFAVPGG